MAELNTPSFSLETPGSAVEKLVRRVREHRLQRNLTQVEVATRAGVSPATYQNFEAGYPPNLNSLLRILGAFGFLTEFANMVPPVMVAPTSAELLQQTGPRQRSRTPGVSR